jgi:hypothetical protein
MILLKDFLEKEILGTAFNKIRNKAGTKKFARFLSKDTNKDWGTILSRFALNSPWTYWDENTVNEALEILEIENERTIEAINFRSNEIGIAIDNLFRLSPALAYEESLDAGKPRELLQLATEFHPEYLRHNEHIFGNLLSLYWSVLKKKSVQGSFDIRAAVNLVESKGHQSILLGYDDRIRNAIAHGQVTFKGLGSIQYGNDNANYSIQSSEFLRIFDSLWRTCNSLTIAVLLFLARNEQEIKTKGISLPPSLIAFIASSIIERKTLSITGAIESENYLAGKQLHIFVRTSYLRREWVLYDCMRISALLLKHGANGYDRFLFDIDQAKNVSSQVIIKSTVLANLLENPTTPLEKMSEALNDSPLLWFNESQLLHRLKSWKEIFSSLGELHWKDVENQWENLGLRVSNQSYRIIKVKNQSTDKIRRIQVYAVLNNHEFVDDRNFIKRVVKKIIKRASKMTFKKESNFSGRFSIYGYPTYVWVSLYKNDGTYRWITSDGWLGGNLIATGEKVFSYFKPPISIKNPEEIWKGIRIRYSIDAPAYAESMVSLATTLSEIEQDKQNNLEK